MGKGKQKRRFGSIIRKLISLYAKFKNTKREKHGKREFLEPSVAHTTLPCELKKEQPLSANQLSTGQKYSGQHVQRGATPRACRTQSVHMCSQPRLLSDFPFKAGESFVHKKCPRKNTAVPGSVPGKRPQQEEGLLLPLHHCYGS